MLLIQITVGILGVVHAAAAFFYFSKSRHATIWAIGWLLFASICIGFMPAHMLLVVGVFLGVVLLWTVWWMSIRALPEREWVIENARQATATIDGDMVTIFNCRNFDWRSRRDFTARWEDRKFDVRDLEAIDLFVSTWADPRMAHIMLSFEFRNAPPLVFSVETRRETDETWSSLAGFMKSYELIIIAGDERDLVYARTNIRHESVHLYRLISSPAMRRQLFLHYVRAMNRLDRRPRFYNTVLSNCTTEVARIVRATGRRLPLDWRILISGYVPIYLYDHGLIDNTRPFAEIQAAADIAAKARARTDTEGFSTRIRDGLHDPVPHRDHPSLKHASP
jgi:Domain of unknown function (DUF4105)